MGLINTETPSIPKQKMEEYIWVMTGRNKIGKTTLAKDFPKPYFFLFEPGSSGLLTYETDILKEANTTGMHPWELFKKAINEFIENNGYGFKTAVIDPAGRAFDYCSSYICQREGIDDLGDLEWGKGWRMVFDEFSSIVWRLVSNDFTMLFIAHLDYNSVKDGKGNEKDVLDLDLSGKSGQFLKNITDVFMLLDFDEEGNRKIFLRPTTNKESGSRLDFGVDAIDLDYNVLKETFEEAIQQNNEKQGVTQEMIDRYYEKEKQQKAKEQKKNKLIKQITNTAKKKGLNGTKNAIIMNEQVGCKRLSRLTLEKAKKYLDYLENEYEG